MSTTPAHPAQTGTFIKTPAPQIVEILALSGLDFAVVDAEHAPFDAAALDLMMLAGRAARLPLLVRVPDFSASTLLRTLDLGAAGVLVPHVDSADDARAVVQRCRYRAGVRGYSGSPRAAGYGSLGMSTAVDLAEQVLVICQIESAAAVAHAAEIAAVPGVDGIFIGRADLALSMGLFDARHPDVMQAARTAIEAGVASGKRVGVLVGSNGERDEYARLGADWFIHGSDQSLLKQAAGALTRGLARQ